MIRMKVEKRPLAWSRTGYNPRTKKRYTKTPLRSYERALAWRFREVAAGHKPWDEPVALTLRFVFKRPKRLAKGPMGRLPHASRPDVDNLTKAVLDALTKAGAWVDDDRVAELFASKWYGEAGEPAYVEIEIETLRDRRSRLSENQPPKEEES